MPVRNNGPGGYSRASTTRKSKVEPEYPQWAESKMRAIENRRLKELQAVVRDSMPEILAIAADEMDTASESIRKDGYSDMVRRIQNRFRIMRDRLSRRLKTDPLERDVRRCADYTDRRQLQEWQRSVRATLGIDISKDFFIGERYEQMFDGVDLDTESLTKALGRINGKALSKLVSELILEHSNVSYRDPDRGSYQPVTEDEFDEIFCQYLAGMFSLCAEIIKLNFSGFFKDASTLFGGLIKVRRGDRSKNTENSTTNELQTSNG